MKQNTHNRTCITIRNHKHNKKIHYLQNKTEAYKTYNHIYNDKKWDQKDMKGYGIHEKAI